MIKKRSFLVAGSFIAFACVLSMAFCYLQWKDNALLREQYDAKKELLKSAQGASRRMKELQAQSDELKEKERLLAAKVPMAEEYPLALVKALTRAAEQAGLGELKFTVKEDSSLQPALIAVVPGFEARYFTMKCAGSYKQLLRFLAGLRAIPRITTVERITVFRQKEMLPDQAFSVDLAAYVFTKQLPASSENPEGGDQ